MNAVKREQVVAVAKAYYPGSKDVVTTPAVLMILDYLAEDETPLACILAGISMRDRDRIGESGCLWATDKRLVFVGLTSVFARQPKIIEFPYREIKSIEVGKGGLLGFGGQKVIFEFGGKTYIFMVSKSSSLIYEFVDQIGKLMRGETATFNLPQDGQAGPLDISAQLERLAQLHDQGALSEEEFSSAKEKILHS